MITEGWKREKLTSLADFINGYAFKPDDWGKEGLPIIRIEQLKDPNKITDFYNGKLPSQNIIENGDLIFSWSASLFLSIWKHGKAALNQHLFKVIEKNGIDRIFLKYIIEFYIPVFEGASHGSTMKHITRKALNTFEVDLPENNIEQSLIAEILSTVDRAIEQTEAVIAKLQRIKAGLMQDLLTRGIDEQGNIRSEKTHRFKDSPLGRIPVEWEVVELENSLINIIDGDRGKNYPKENEFDSTGFCLFLSAENVTKNGFKFHRAQFINKRKDSLLRKGKLELYDIVLTTRGTVGNFAYYSKQIPYKNIRINSGMVILRNRNKNLSTEFIYYALKDYLFKIEYSIKFSGSAQPQLPIKDLKKFHIIIPKKEEQFKILNVINSFENSLNNELVKLKKLKRLKTALMQDLLTGRVRVTGLLKKRQAEAAVNR
ncbi:restriction endonuclease subunit S [Caldithrix abyssi]